jgi:hypothetical protein
MALLAALTSFVPATQDVMQRTLRPLVTDLTAVDVDSYTAGQLICDLRGLRLKGIVWQMPKRQHYQLTPYGRRVALFLTRLQARVFRQGFAALDPSCRFPARWQRPWPRWNRKSTSLPATPILCQATEELDSFVKNSQHHGIARPITSRNQSKDRTIIPQVVSS